MLIPCLLGLLSITVLAMFSHLENELRLRLESGSIYRVYVNEIVSPDDAPTILRNSYQDELVWSNRYGSAFRKLRQPLVSAQWNLGPPLPVYAYTSSLSGLDLDAEAAAVDHPVAWLLTEQEALPTEWQQVSLSERRMMALPGRVPPWLGSTLSVDSALLAPMEMMEPILARGFIIHIIGEFKSIAEVRGFVNEISAYYRAEGRRVRIVSSLEILDSIERITALQQVVRTLIVLGCGFILALTLGSVAWLEYRQESYLLALLKSFGTPSFILFAHMFLENLLLVMLGAAIAGVAWPGLYQIIAEQLPDLGMASAKIPSIRGIDLTIIYAASFVGVLLAMLPVAFGLRRRPGLILQ